MPYSLNTYLSRFQGWNKAILAAGLPCREAKGGWARHDSRWDSVTKAEVVRYLRAEFGEAGFLPSKTDYDAGNYLYPSSLLMRLFRTWRDVAEAAGLKQTIKTPEMAADYVSDDDLLLYLMVRYEKTRVLPKIKDYMRSNPKYSYILYRKRFGGWANAAKLIGYQLASDLQSNEYAPDEVLLDLMIRYEDSGILPTAKRYRASKPKYSYELCIKLFKTWRRTAKLAGLVLESDLRKQGTTKVLPADPVYSETAA